MVTLYSCFRSSAAWRVRICLALKGVNYDLVPIDIRDASKDSPEYCALHPQGFVPTLMTEAGALSQSFAIIEYLDSIYAAPPLCHPVTIDRARVQAMAALIACDIHPLNNLRVLNYLRTSLALDESQVSAWYRHWVQQGLAALEQMVKAYGATFCFGVRITLADICLVPHMYNARRFSVDLTPYPTLKEIDSHLQALPAIAESAPERQIDAA